MANKLRKWLKNRQRDRRGPEIEYLVPDMLQYVKDNYPVSYFTYQTVANVYKQAVLCVFVKTK